VGWDWVHLVRRPLFGLLYQPQMIYDDACGEIGGMGIGRGNRSTRRKPTLVPLRPPQIPHDLTWARTRANTVGSRRLTAWAMALLRRRVIFTVRYEPNVRVSFGRYSCFRSDQTWDKPLKACYRLDTASRADNIHLAASNCSTSLSRLWILPSRRAGPVLPCWQLLFVSTHRLQTETCN
jgi:hypothetical protein